MFFESDAKYDEYVGNIQGSYDKIAGILRGGEKSMGEIGKVLKGKIADAAQYKPSTIAARKQVEAEDSRRKEKSKLLADTPGLRAQTRTGDAMMAAISASLAPEDNTFAYRLV